MLEGGAEAVCGYTWLFPWLFVLSLRACVCVAALGGDALLERYSKRCSLLNRLHPVVWFGACAARGESVFNRDGVGKHFWRGALWSGALVALAFGAGFVLDRLLWREGEVLVLIGSVFGSVFIGVFVCSVLIAHASLARHVARVEQALREKALVRARRELSHIVGRETKALSSQAVARGALESLSENCSDGTVAPLFYYLVAGLGGLFAYKAINTLDSMFGYRGRRYGAFGRFAARVDDVANILPARLTAWIFCAAAFFSRNASFHNASFHNALRVMRADGLSLRAWVREGFVSSPNASHPEAALAGALNIRLGGVREYRLHGEVWRAGKVIGEGGRDGDFRDLARARKFVDRGVLAFFILLATMLVAILSVILAASMIV